MEKLISVIIATYKRIEGLIPTLESVRLQEYANKELIIADDGSGNEIISIINKYIEENKKYFNSVTFIKNETNLGTVKNIQNAYRIAKGEIIKVLSPGDLFYDQMVLKNINCYFEENSSLIACGIPRTYHKKNDRIIDDFLYNYSTYINLNDSKKTLFNLLYASRYLIGATLVFHKDIFEKFDLFLPDKVKYSEDLIQVYATLKGIRIHLIDSYMIWYEYGSGISTSNNSSWSNIFIQDNVSFYKWLLENRLITKKNIRNVSTKLSCFNKPGRYPTFFRCLKNPSFLTFKFLEKLYPQNDHHKEILSKHHKFLENQNDGFKELIIRNY